MRDSKSINPSAPSIRSRSFHILLKLVLIGVCAVVLLIPLIRITFLIEEREHRQWQARREITQSWGEPQQVGAPVLSIPFQRVMPKNDDSNGFFFVDHVLRALPEELHYAVDIEPQVRRRGLFEAVVYRAKVTVRGHLRMPSLERFAIDPDRIQWRDARVSFGLGHLRGLDGVPTLVLTGKPLALEAGNSADSLMGEALAAPLPAALEVDVDQPFELTFTLRGSDGLRFVPLGRQTTARLSAPWPDPSFQGSFLPAAPRIGAEGFEAGWSVPHFARSVPQAFIDQLDPKAQSALTSSTFGADLLLPVDFYQLVSRCTKYAVLFIGLTFGTFFLFERLAGLRIHPVQYLLVGFALCLFYLLLLALAEHTGFQIAYLTASVPTIALITSYCASALGNRSRALILGLLLTVLYGLLFVLVQLQTYSLLVGSITLFAILAAAMFLTRDIDWYQEASYDEMPAEGAA